MELRLWLGKHICTAGVIHLSDATSQHLHLLLVTHCFLFPSCHILACNRIAKHTASLLSSYTYSGTIGDYLTYLLTSTQTVSINVTNAVAWGCVTQTAAEGTVTYSWDEQRIQSFGIPLRLLPRIIPSLAHKLDTVHSNVATHWHLSCTCAVHSCIGDNQSSIYALQLLHTDLCLYMGTSAQLCAVVPDTPVEQSDGASYENASNGGLQLADDKELAWVSTQSLLADLYC